MSTKRLLAASAAALTLAIAGSAFAGGFDSESLPSGANLSAFKSVYVAPVALDLDLDVSGYPGLSDGDRPVSDKDAAEKAADFHDDLVDAFDNEFAVAGAPGPGVLTIAATLTDLRSSRPTMADYDRQTGLSRASVYAGGAAVSIALSEGGSAIAQVSDDYDTSLSDGRSRIATWDDADRAFSSWARRLVEFVQEH